MGFTSIEFIGVCCVGNNRQREFASECFEDQAGAKKKARECKINHTGRKRRCAEPIFRVTGGCTNQKDHAGAVRAQATVLNKFVLQVGAGGEEKIHGPQLPQGIHHASSSAHLDHWRPVGPGDHRFDPNAEIR
jgi:hypothetical protein